MNASERFVLLVIAAGLLIAAMILLPTMRSHGRELFPGQYAQVDRTDRQWFRSQVSPKTGVACCSEADGEYAEEKIEGAHYWTRWSAHTEWMEVPDEVVIRTPNRHGRPVVWWGREPGHSGTIFIRCYAIGAEG